MRLIAKALIVTTVFTVVAVTTHEASAIQCARYARIAGPIKIRGDAWTWWNKAIGQYARVKKPVEGAAIVFSKTRRNRFGHVAVISAVISQREIKIFHANWLNNGRVYKDQLVIDVSPDGDWSKVRVWNPGINRMGKHRFPIQGFIHPTRSPMADEYLTPSEVMIARGISETAKGGKRRSILVAGGPARKPDVPAWVRGRPTAAEPAAYAMADLPLPPLPRPPRPSIPLPRPDRAGLMVASADGGRDGVPALEPAEVERPPRTVAMLDDGPAPKPDVPAWARGRPTAAEPAAYAMADLPLPPLPRPPRPSIPLPRPDRAGLMVASADGGRDGVPALEPAEVERPPRMVAMLDDGPAEPATAELATVELATVELAAVELAAVETDALEIPAGDTTSQAARTIRAAVISAPLPRPAGALIVTAEPFTAEAVPAAPTMTAALPSIPPRKPTPPTVAGVSSPADRPPADAAAVPAVQVAALPQRAAPLVIGGTTDETAGAAGSVDVLARFDLPSGPVARFLPTQPGAVTAPTRAPVVIAAGPMMIADTTRARVAAERFGLTSGPVAKFLPQMMLMMNEP